jgi:hypothetical protein
MWQADKKLEPTAHDDKVVPKRGYCEDAFIKGDPPGHIIPIAPSQTDNTIINVELPMMQRYVEHLSSGIIQLQKELRWVVGLVAGELEPLAVAPGTDTERVRYPDLSALANATRQC